MIRRAGHAVNSGDAELTRGSAADQTGMPELPEALALAAGRVAAWGGDTHLFAGLCARADAATLSGEDMRAAGVVAAWRAGVLGLRAEGLRSAAALLQSVGAARVGLLLGLPADQVGAFLDAQATDRFAWPAWRDLGRDYAVATIGGFVGLGGRWTRPPTEVLDVAPGCWLVTTGAETWRIDADIFGHVVAAADGEQPDRSGERTTAWLHTQQSSYLVTVVARG